MFESMGLMFEDLAIRMYESFRKDRSSAIMFFFAAFLFPPLSLLITSLLGWTGANIFMLFVTMLMFTALLLGGQVIGAGVGKAVDILDRDKVNDSERAAKWANTVGTSGIIYTLVWEALAFMWKPASDPGIFVIAFVTWLAAFFVLKKKGTDGAKKWQDRIEALFITLLLCGLANMLYLRFIPKAWRIMLGRNNPAFVNSWGMTMSRDMVIVNKIGENPIMGPLVSLGVLVLFLSFLGFASLLAFKKSGESVLGVSRDAAVKVFGLVCMITLVLVLGFFVLGALVTGGGQASLASATAGVNTGIDGMISYLWASIIVIVAFIPVLGCGRALVKKFSLGMLAGFIFFLVVGIMTVRTFVPAIMGIHPSQHMSSELNIKTPADTVWVAQATFKVWPHSITYGQKTFGLQIPRGDVLPLLLEDGTIVKVVSVWGAVTSNQGSSLADRSIEGDAWPPRPCYSDSLLPYPVQVEFNTWFASTRYASATAKVNRCILSFEKPGGPACAGAEIKAGSIFTVVDGPVVAVGHVNFWNDGSPPSGYYLVTLTFNRKPRPYNVATTTALLPKPGTMLTTSSPFSYPSFAAILRIQTI